MRGFVIVVGAVSAMLIIGNLVLPAINPWLEAAVSFVRSQLIIIGVPADTALTIGIILNFVVSIALVWSPAFIAWRSWRRIRSKPWVYDWAEMHRNPWKYDQRKVIPKPSWRQLLVTAMFDMFLEIVTWIAVLIGLTCIAVSIIFFQR